MFSSKNQKKSHFVVGYLFNRCVSANSTTSEVKVTEHQVTERSRGAVTEPPITERSRGRYIYSYPQNEIICFFVFKLEFQ